MHIILTGGHTGMGLELSRLLLGEGHTLTLIVRTEKRQAEAQQALGGSEKIHYHLADLSVQADVRSAGDEIVARGVPVDGLFNNAGVLLDQSYRSAQDNEMHYEVNALAPYILTTTLWPALAQSPAPFVVNTATGSMEKRKTIDMQ
ncbi:MAG: SDR family NAD(P)-dependent oxidoreductase, partial [Acidobacteriota bacterium]